MTDICSPFTEEELFRAFRFGLPDAEAQDLAREYRKTDYAEDYARLGIHTRSDELCIMYSDDLLILLSLVSDELNAKVERYRADRGGTWDLNPAQWRQRREQLRAALRSEGKLPPPDR